jgi:type IV fimbrial biogenesis protein FimT
MNSSVNRQEGQVNKTALNNLVHNYPFVCQKQPFICLMNKSKIPFVINFRPFVCYLINSAGFTLIELFVTISIVSILAFVAAPSLNSMIKDHRLSGYTNDLMSDLNFARSEALKRAASITICKQDTSSTDPACNTDTSNTWTGGRVIFLDSDNDGQVDSNETIFRIRESLTGQNLTLTAQSTSEATGASPPTYNLVKRIVYRSDGTVSLPTGTEAYLRFCDERGIGKARTVLLSFSGRSRATKTPPSACP